jgi:hypothetical protein
MCNMFTIGQIILEVDCFQKALDTHDSMVTLEYMRMLYDDVRSDDDKFIFALCDELGLTAHDFIIPVIANEKFKFMCFRILSEDDILKYLDDATKVIGEALNMI